MTEVQILSERIYKLMEYLRIAAAQESSKAPPYTPLEIVSYAVQETDIEWLTDLIDDLTYLDQSHEDFKDATKYFLKWANDKVFVKVVEYHLETLRKEGLVEYKTVDKDGNFSYGITDKGKKVMKDFGL